MTPEQMGALGFLLSVGALVGIWAHMIVSHGEWRR